MRSIALLFFALVTLPCTAQQSRPALTPAQVIAIDQFVEKERVRQQIPGIEVGIYSHGKLLLTKGYGLANVELDVPMKAQTIMQSGSTGKQFMATAVMMLVEQHKISLDDSVRKYFPAAPEWWQPIKIKNLLSHTSGLTEYETKASETDPKDLFYLRKDMSEAELATNIQTLPRENAPGDKWNYRNTNFVLLGIVVHQVTGQFYGNYLHDRIFAPLGMTSTRIISDRDIIKDRASGYELVNGEWKNQQWVSPTFNSTADGTLYYNVLDLAKWDEALYTTRLVTQASLDQMWTVFPLNEGKPNPADYGFAWVIDKQNGHKRIWHGGAWQGFTTAIMRYPEDSLGVVVLTNLDSGHARPSPIAQVIAGLVEPALLPALLQPVADTEPSLAQILRRVIDLAAAGLDAPNLLTGNAAKRWTSELAVERRSQLQQVWPGGAVALVQRSVSEDKELTTSLYRVVRHESSKLVQCVTDRDGKVATLRVLPDRDFQ
jgi:CubicO group peptidase (beta-lactamase class C family)